jgi:molybdopterin/thiamine biosynthesis adenylyltransferase
MKKILAILAFFLAFSIGASAQESQKDVYASAQADFAALNAVIPISKKIEKDIKETLYDKHKFLISRTDVTAEQKAQLSTEIETKLAEILSPEQFRKLKANQQLFKKLTQ